MRILDAQVHCYEKNHPGRPWQGFLHGPDEVTGDAMVAAMDAVGVDGAILVSPHSMYRFDASYALEVYAKHPTRFRLVKPVDPADPGVAETITEWARTPGVCGIRIMLNRGVSDDPADPGIGLVMKTAASLNLPINMLIWGRLAQMDALAARYPDTGLVIDHLGLQQPFEPPVPERPWAELPNVLAMARHPNVVIKISGACTLSKQAYLYDDIWDNVRRVIDAYGVDRCLWGTDWTRAVALLNYREGVDSFRLNNRFPDSEKAILMGGSVARVYGWSET